MILVHIGMAFPSVTVAGHFVISFSHILSQPWGLFESPPAGAYGAWNIEAFQKTNNSPVARTRAVIKMGCQTWIGNTVYGFYDLVDGFISFIVLGQRKFCPCLHVEHD